MPCSLWYCSLNAPIPRKSGCSSPLVAGEWESPCGEVEQQAVRSRFPALGVRRLPTAGLSSDSVDLLVLLPFIPSIEHIFKCFRFFDLGAQEPRGEDLLVLVPGRRVARSDVMDDAGPVDKVDRYRPRVILPTRLLATAYRIADAKQGLSGRRRLTVS